MALGMDGYSTDRAYSLMVRGQKAQQAKDSQEAYDLMSEQLGPKYGGLMVNPARAKKDARGVMADIIRSQFEDFSSSALPMRRELEAMTTYNGNTGVLADLQEQGTQNVADAFGNVMPSAQRQARRFGMALSPDEQSVLARSADLGQAVATTDTLNRAVDVQKDLNRSIVAGAGMSAGRNYGG